LPNSHAHTYENTRTYTHTKRVERVKKRGKETKTRGGSGKKERKEKKKDQKKTREKGKKRGEREKKWGEGQKRKKKEGGGWVQGVRGAWVLKNVRSRTNKSRSTSMFFSFSSPSKGQTTQTTPLTMRS